MTAERDPSGIVNRPAAACPKCGHAYGFLWAKPTFKQFQNRDVLLWECGTCGYEVLTPTADATKAVPA